MDPTACLSRMLYAIADGDAPEAAHSLRELKGWIDSGGFLPGIELITLPGTDDEYFRVGN